MGRKRLEVVEWKPGFVRRALFANVLVACSGLLLAFNAVAQSSEPPPATSSGAVMGHVRGPGGVAVPGATVELIETQTGQRKETWTDESGNYTLTGVELGTYKLQVSLVGFRTDVREPVPMATAKSLKVNIGLVMNFPEERVPAGQKQASGPPNVESLPPEIRERRRTLAAARAAGGGVGDEGAGWGNDAGNVRFSESPSASGQPQGASSESASPTSTTSSAHCTRIPYRSQRAR